MSFFDVTLDQVERAAREAVAHIDELHRKCQERFAEKWAWYDAADELDSDAFRQVFRDFDAERFSLMEMRRTYLQPLIRLKALDPRMGAIIPDVTR